MFLTKWDVSNKGNPRLTILEFFGASLEVIYQINGKGPLICVVSHERRLKAGEVVGRGWGPFLLFDQV